VEAMSEEIIKKTEDERKEREAGAAEQQLDLFNLQPKRPNWDLKRDLERKLELLKPRTNAAVAQILKNRIAAENGSKQNGGSVPSNLAESVHLMEQSHNEELAEADV
jgi:coiled-coil domain-containing protein 12